jgi:hypothetical protein
MTLLANWRSPRLDRDAAFDAAVREGQLPVRDQRCPYCGQTMPAGASHGAAPRGRSEPAAAAPSVDEELAALSNGHAK